MHRGRREGRKWGSRGGAAVAMTVTSGVGERTRPLPHARARTRAHTSLHTHTRARIAALLRHTGGKGQTKGKGMGRPEEPPPPRAMTDTVEAAFSPRTPPSRCSRRAPCPRPPSCPFFPASPPPWRSRGHVRPPPTPRLRRASGLGRALAGSGCRRVGAAAAGLAACSRDPRPPRPETAR